MITQGTYNKMVEDFTASIQKGFFSSESQFEHFKNYYINVFDVNETFAKNFVERMRKIHGI